MGRDAYRPTPLRLSMVLNQSAICLRTLTFLAATGSCLSFSATTMLVQTRASGIARLHMSIRSRRSVLRCRASAEGDGNSEVSIGWKRQTGQDEELPTGVMPCILVPVNRLSLPGQLREVHLYDVSNLAVLRFELAFPPSPHFACHLSNTFYGWLRHNAFQVCSEVYRRLLCSSRH